MSVQPTTASMIDVRAYLDGLLPVAGLDETRNGLVIGGRPLVAKIGLAVNCSVQAIEAAVERGCDLLITHHAATPATDAHLAEVKYAALRERGLNLYVADDCLDQARDLGTADALARAVQVGVQGPFRPDGQREFGVHGVVAGRLAEFAARVGNRLGFPPRLWKHTDAFGHVAVVAGGGGRPQWMAQAQALGCDTYLTGEADLFGLLFAREAGLNLILAGHQATETPGMLALSARIARDLHIDLTFLPEEMVEARA